MTNEFVEKEMQKFVFHLTDTARSKAEWLLIMQFGLLWFLEHQDYLFTVIARRAEYEVASENINCMPSEMIAPLFSALDLKVSISKSSGG